VRLSGMKSVVLVVLGAACNLNGTRVGGSGGILTPPPNGVYMQDLTFDPDNLTVAVGTTVTWTNKDVYTHTVIYSSGPDSAFSDTVVVGASFQHTFKTAGTYQYYCGIHGTPTTGMGGTIVVQ